ncbi:FtsX-like permease family protein [Sphingobacterium shayense]|uniref:ABC transporter permease n=1 Tax=Sphingobacterium shayense TaxID=626343 RepID=UPI0015571B64|nr:ABC transporter permease [Sphingobacterium shayense]NQD69365.1 FtsX-like permease family protein [Sphingobacterium shayense]
MLKNYIKLAWRNLKGQKLFSTIKIGGFAFSIAVCIMIVLFVQHELSYDKFYPEEEQIFRMLGNFKKESGIERGTSFPAPAGPTMKETYPTILESGRILPSSLFGAGNNQVTTDENPVNQSLSGFVYADQSILDMFPIPAVYGSLKNALDKPNTVVLSKSKAALLFKGNPVGKVVYLNNDKQNPYEITAVLADIPHNSHLFGYDIFLTLSGINFYDGEQQNWISSNYTTYFKIKSGTDIHQLEGQLTKTYIEDHYIPSIKMAGRTVNPMVKESFISLQPVNQIHLHSKDVHDDKVSVQNRGDIRIVWIFAGIAIFILLIASINFINLTTANVAVRAKEVGIRKTIGSSRKSLIYQFFTESFLYCAISVFLGLLITIILLPLFNQIAGKSLSIPLFNLQFIGIMLLGAIILGALSGIYPALFLSRFKPISILKGKVLHSKSSGGFRNSLVIFQFVTSITLIIGTIIIHQQMNFLMNKDLGYNKDQVLMLHGTHTLGKQIKSFKEQLKTISNVHSVSIGDYVPVDMVGSRRNGNPFWQDGKQSEDDGKPGQFWIIDQDYISTYGLNLVAGRNLSFDMPTDSSGTIINQKMVKELGLKNPIGSKIFNGETRTVVGVVEDFIFDNMRSEAEAVRPVSLVLGNSPSLISIKVSSLDMAGTISQVTDIWDEFSPNQKIQFSFLDDNFSALYSDVKQTQTIFTSFAFVAIFIACLGLFGLAAFITAQRTKEIGVRKVLGATVTKIIKLLSIDFLKLVLVAILIAVPFAWWVMHAWLEDFNNRIEIKYWVFILAGAISLFIAAGTICYHAFKTARMNPVTSLRDE